MPYLDVTLRDVLSKSGPLPHGLDQPVAQYGDMTRVGCCEPEDHGGEENGKRGLVLT